MELGTQIATLRGHHDAVTSLAWLDDQYLLSASTDGSIRRWDTSTGVCEYSAYQLPEDGWVTIYPDNRFRANEVGKRYLTYAAPDWALYPAELFPELEITDTD